MQGKVLEPNVITHSAAISACGRGEQSGYDQAVDIWGVGLLMYIMLFGVKHDQTKADFQTQRLGPVDAILIASDLSVSPSLTKVR